MKHKMTIAHGKTFYHLDYEPGDTVLVGKLGRWINQGEARRSACNIACGQATPSVPTRRYSKQPMQSPKRVSNSAGTDRGTAGREIS
ncbi:hypothetical protein ABER61_03070 [Brevibacillus formosus]|uniref:Uncharacterized protein n=1 Tax=Brevibacillus formosus TaxID=54913 RepID=A0A837KDC9_9BACL|nr:hypothetical protein [Brevibacillus formosus]KLH95847.1 hypothetical protein AA984_28705 [Brevibacillus formosus]MED1955153.1 hypothetical protein [Brevibacillus formosus]PSJ94966.1 hypothetical protein C7R91_16925 [Brevibacillus formosus]GED58399.1 hypothetical protein BFO01nite_25310 [Brevibacillus formosus]